MRHNNEQLSVLQIVQEDGSTTYFNDNAFVSNPYYANRYYPVGPEGPGSQTGRDRDIEYLKKCTEGDFSFVPYLDAVKKYNLSTENID